MGNNQQKKTKNRRKYLQITPNKGLTCKIKNSYNSVTTTTKKNPI